MQRQPMRRNFWNAKRVIAAVAGISLLTTISYYGVRLHKDVVASRKMPDSAVLFPAVNNTSMPTKASSQLCTSDGKICLVNKNGWEVPAGVFNQDSFFTYQSADGTARIDYWRDISQAKPNPACSPTTCLVTLVSVEPFAQFPDTDLVRAVYQDKNAQVIEDNIGLLSVSTITAKKLAIGQTIDYGEDYQPSFVNTAGGVSDTLDAYNYQPGTFDTMDAAKQWFDTTAATSAYTMLQSLEVTK